MAGRVVAVAIPACPYLGDAAPHAFSIIMAHRQPRPTDSTHVNGDLNSHQKMQQQRCHVPVDPTQCSVHYCHFKEKIQFTLPKESEKRRIPPLAFRPPLEEAP